MSTLFCTKFRRSHGYHTFSHKSSLEDDVIGCSYPKWHNAQNAHDIRFFGLLNATKPPWFEVVLFVSLRVIRCGGEGGIRTLEQCYPLHDFQSCALDQTRRLLQFTVINSTYIYYHTFGFYARVFYIDITFKILLSSIATVIYEWTMIFQQLNCFWYF